MRRHKIFLALTLGCTIPFMSSGCTTSKAIQKEYVNNEMSTHTEESAEEASTFYRVGNSSENVGETDGSATGSNEDDIKAPTEKNDQGSLDKYIEWCTKLNFGDNAKVKQDGNDYYVTVTYSSDDYLSAMNDYMLSAFYSSVYYGKPAKYDDFSVQVTIKSGKDIKACVCMSTEDAKNESLSYSSNTTEDAYADSIRINKNQIIHNID